MSNQNINTLQGHRSEPLPSYWARSPDGILGGVCKGLAEKLNLDPLLVRIVWLIGLFFGVGILLYITLFLAFPRRDRIEGAWQKKILGVCLKISQKWSWDPGVVRFIALWLLIATGGTALLMYLAVFVLLLLDPS